MNRCAKFDAASFILGGEIRNRTKKQTKLQTVKDISTPCLSACVDNNHIGLLIQQKYLHIYSAVLNMCHNGHEHKYDAKIDNEK